MKSFTKKNKDDDHEEKLVTINTDKAGCAAMNGAWNPKSGQCDVRQDKYKDRPNEVTNRKFDTVERPEEIGGVKVVEDE
jgi:hypothetical protein